MPFNQEDIAFIVKMANYIETTAGQTESVGYLKIKFKCGGERVEARGEFENWLDVYNEIFTVYTEEEEKAILTQTVMTMRQEIAEA